MPTPVDRFRALLSRQFSQAPEQGLTLAASQRGGDTASRVMSDQVRSLARKPGHTEAASFWKERLAVFSNSQLRGAAMGAMAALMVVAAPKIERTMAETNYVSHLAAAAEQAPMSGSRASTAASLAGLPWAFDENSLSNPDIVSKKSPGHLLAQAMQNKVSLYVFQPEALGADPDLADSEILAVGKDAGNHKAKIACGIAMGSLMQDIATQDFTGTPQPRVALYQVSVIAERAAACFNESRPKLDGMDPAAMRANTALFADNLAQYHYSRMVDKTSARSFGVAFAHYWATTSPDSKWSATDGSITAEVAKSEWASRAEHDIGAQSPLSEGVFEDLADLYSKRINLIADGASVEALRTFDAKAVKVLLDSTAPDHLIETSQVIGFQDFDERVRAINTPYPLAAIVAAAAPAYRALGIEVTSDRFHLRNEIVGTAQAAAKETWGAKTASEIFNTEMGPR